MTKRTHNKNTGSVTFPLRVAAIDIGTNAIRFMACEFLSHHRYVTLDSQRTSVRLGHNTFLSGRLDDEAMDKAVMALESFRKKMRSLDIEHYRAVATSAVRESSNGSLFVRRIKHEAGINADIITGSEEARLVYTAVKRRVPFGNKKWLIANLGGGSLEVALVDSANMLWNETHSVGAVRLYEELSDSGKEPPRYHQLLEEYLSTVHISKRGSSHKPHGFIGTGGNIEELARLADAHIGERGTRILTVAKLRSLASLLSKLSYKERVKKMGLRKDRADVIIPAAMVYERLARLIGVKDIIVPYTGTREGIVFDLVDHLTTQSAHEMRQEKQLSSVAVRIGQHYKFDQLHSLHVAHLATSLFDQMQDIHKLTVHDRNILLVAGILHDIGTYISYKGHHKHSFYLISQSEIPGFSARDMLVAANVARYHRKAEPSAEHDNYAQLTREEELRASKMASILRIADALDREHAQSIKCVTASIDKSYLTLTLETDGDVRLERWALRKKDKLFERLFDLKVRLSDGLLKTIR